MVFKSKKGDIAENALVVANIDRFNMVKDKLRDVKLVNDFMGDIIHIPVFMKIKD